MRGANHDPAATGIAEVGIPRVVIVAVVDGETEEDGEVENSESLGEEDIPETFGP
jgi:hypothetical protein